MFLASIGLISTFFTVGYSDDLIIQGNGHAPFYVSNTDSGRFDFGNDNKTDYFVKAHYTGNSNQQLKIDYKIQDNCVDGDVFGSAIMKMGLSSTGSPSERKWFQEDVTLSNHWFKNKKHDSNKMIDLAIFPDGHNVIPFPSEGNGDDAIQGSKNQGSFKHLESIEELDGQSGWQGNVFLNAPAGEYFLWTIHNSGGTESCSRLAGLGIPIIVE